MGVSFVSPRVTRVLAVVFFCTTVLLAVGLGASWTWFRHLMLRAPLPQIPEIVHNPAVPTPVSPLLVAYRLDLPGRGEIFPALAGATDKWPVAILTIANQSDRAIVQDVLAQLRGWSNPLEQTLVIGPRETRTLDLAPELLPEAYDAQEIRRTTLEVRVTNGAGETAYAQHRAVLLHSASDLYWGERFANAQYIARWVTPHEPAVLRLVSDARSRAPGGRFRGYQNPRDDSPRGVARQVNGEARAVFDTLRNSGLAYVSSIFTFGAYDADAQRIRLPAETLTLKNANCIDVSVAFASAMENLGMRPVIVIVPGHAFVGVRLGPQTQDALYLDLTVLPGGTMEEAVRRAASWFRKYPANQLLTVDIGAARAMKIYPLPSSQPERWPEAVSQSTALAGRRHAASE
jgi:hypothetical protein